MGSQRTHTNPLDIVLSTAKVFENSHWYLGSSDYTMGDKSGYLSQTNEMKNRFRGKGK